MSGVAPGLIEPGALAPEDAARARWYALFAELFRAPASRDALAAIAASAQGGASSADDGALAQAWRGFARACAGADPQTVSEEFDAAFVGVGKADVILYASYHLCGFLNDRPLVELREQLAVLGLSRRAGIAETEDHLSALCETMAWLISSDAAPARDIAAQRAFFSRFLAPWFEPLADAIEHSGVTDFYKHAGRLLREFLVIERQAFEFESL